MPTHGGSIRLRQVELSKASNAGAEILQAADAALANANANAGRNTYLWRDEEWTHREAQRVAAMPPAHGNRFDTAHPAFWGIPVSVKDCFDLAGAPTSCGTNLYRDLNGISENDSWLVDQLRQSGAVITGKTHLHPLAYGITGENPEFGDCLQPGNPSALTGGSSSGAAASILEGSAMAAIGTDTGGSIRVPAALCGIAGYRASLGRGDWRGAAHLAPSFDTMGFLFRDLEDAPLLGSLFGSTGAPTLNTPTAFAVIDEAFLHDCEPGVIAGYKAMQAELESLGLTATSINVGWWSDSLEIFAAIQASEAAEIHRGHFGQIGHIDPSIRQRLEWGEAMSEEDIASLRVRHAAFRDRMDALLADHPLLLMPAAPVIQLTAGADHSQTRTRLLRYTTPVSLAGMPAITIPFTANDRPAGGSQLIAAREDDARLLAIAARLGEQRRSLKLEAPNSAQPVVVS